MRDRPQVVYCHGTHYGGKGHGHLAWGTCQGLIQQGLLDRAVCFSVAEGVAGSERVRPVLPLGWHVERLALLPGRLLPSLRFASFRWKDGLFDRLAARRIGRPDVVYGWSHHCLATLHRARRRGLGTVVECPTTHPASQRRILEDECDRWGVDKATQTPLRFVERCVAEFRAADAVCVASDLARRTLVAEGIRGEDIVVAPYGYDEARYYTGEGPDPRAPFRAVFIGMVGLRKGVLYLLEAWKRLGWADAELLLCGGVDPEMRDLLAPYRELAGVRFLGYRDPAPLLRRAHASVLPTLEDGFATVVTESMACGVPVVVTEQTGARDAVTHGEDGLVVPIRDVDALAGALEALRGDPDRRIRMAKAAREKARDWGWGRRAQILAAFLRERFGGDSPSSSPSTSR